MTRWARSLSFALALAACSSGTASSSTPKLGNAIFVQGVLFPTPVAQGQVCTFTADPGQTMLSAGVLDLAFRGAYMPTLLVANQPLAGSDAGSLPSAAVELSGASVQVTDSSGTSVDSFDTLAAAFVYPASGNVPSFSPLAVTIIDAAATATIRGHVSANMTVRLVAHVTVLGTTRGGLAVQSDEFVFPVDVCDGCLVTFSPSDVDPMLPEPNCAGNPALGGSSTNLPVPCVLGQDTPVDCVDCLNVPVCRGVVGADGG